MTDIVIPASASPASPASPSPRTARRQGDVKAVAAQFEAIFLRQMIGAMRGASGGDDLFGSDATRQFRDMSDARLADAIAGRFGIAALLERQVKGAQR